MDEGVHVGCVEIVLLVPGGGRQHDVGVDAGGRHAEVERDQQVELSLRRGVVPGDLLRLAPAVLAQILALHAVRGAEEMLEEILVTLAGRAEQVGAPDEQVARPVVGMVGILAGHPQLSRLERPGDVVLRLDPGGLRPRRDRERVLPELRRRRQPAHPLGAHVVVDRRRPRARPARSATRSRRRRGSRSATGRCGRRRTRSSSADAAAGSSRVRRPAAASPIAAAASPARHNATSRRLTADAAAHHQHVDDAAVVHVGVIPVVHRRADDHHGAALGLLGVEREFARHRDDLIAGPVIFSAQAGV